MTKTGAMSDSRSVGPLAGVRVVELGMWVAAPAAAGLCADWGADVIKVEPPDGDPQRSVFAALGVRDQVGVPPFEMDNRGKRSVILDVRSDEGRQAFEELLAQADVFVTNLRPAALARSGLSPSEVMARHGRLIYASITAYGTEGPDVDRPGYDIGAFYARSGVAATLVPDGEYPPALRSGFGDHFTGLSLAAGIAAKLYERERTGRGGHVTTSLLRTGMYALSWDIGIELRFGRREQTRDRYTSGAPLVNCYRAADGRGFWLLCVQADRHWPKVLAAIDRQELGDEERFSSAAERRRHSAELISVLDAAFARFGFDELTSRFDDADVWWAPINTIADVIADPQARGAGGFVTIDPDDGTTPFEVVNSPVDFEGYRFEPGPVPSLGEHDPTFPRP
ncbi:MAG: CoA transferase [Acidimicrobiia bacterium]|nr:CoA transferase [Acidimicrobiia bacterium]MBA3982116.1 CoA transferase [Acidimicrobiia bacterium]